MSPRKGDMPGGRFALTVILLGLVYALGLLGCGSTSDPSGTRDSDQQLRAARAFRAFPVFYAGAAYRGLALSDVTRADEPYSHGSTVKRLPHAHSPMWSFIYGDCNPRGGENGGCTPPLEVQNYAACARNLHSYGIFHPYRVVRFRGAPAGVFGRPPVFERVEIYTRATTIVIFAASLRAASSLAKRLRTVDGDIPPAARLPPANRQTLAGRVPCHSA